jgi:hypothetical protein
MDKRCIYSGCRLGAESDLSLTLERPDGVPVTFARSLCYSCLRILLSVSVFETLGQGDVSACFEGDVCAGPWT